MLYYKAKHTSDEPSSNLESGKMKSQIPQFLECPLEASKVSQSPNTTMLKCPTLQ